MTDRELTADEALAAALTLLKVAEEQGSNHARHARAMLEGARTSGRHPTDDVRALAEVRALAAAGHARDAIAIVSRRYSTTPREIRATERRLRRKRNQTDVLDLSAPATR